MYYRRRRINRLYKSRQNSKRRFPPDHILCFMVILFIAEGASKVGICFFRAPPEPIQCFKNDFVSHHENYFAETVAHVIECTYSILPFFSSIIHVKRVLWYLLCLKIESQQNKFACKTS